MPGRTLSSGDPATANKTQNSPLAHVVFLQGNRYNTTSLREIRGTGELKLPSECPISLAARKAPGKAVLASQP